MRSVTYDQQTEVVRGICAQLHDLWTTKHPTIDDVLKLIIDMETEAGGGTRPVYDNRRRTLTAWTGYQRQPPLPL